MIKLQLGLGMGSKVPTVAAGGVTFDPYSYTGVNLNMGFREADVTKTGADLITKVVNHGTADLSLAHATLGPTWVSDGAGTGKPGAVFAAAAKLLSRNAADSADVNSSVVISAATGWMLVVVKVDTDGVSTNAGNPFANDGLVDNPGYNTFAMALRSSGVFYACNYDGSIDAVEVATGISFGGVQVYTWKHVSSTLNGSLDGTAGTPIASGSTQFLNVPFQLNKSVGMTVLHVMADDAVPDDEDDIISGMASYYAA